MSEPTVGVVYLCIGRAYADLALISISHLRHWGYRGPIRVVTDRPRRRFGALDCELIPVDPVRHYDTTPRHARLFDVSLDTLSETELIALRNHGFASRFYKTQLNSVCFETTLFIDADAIPVAPIAPIWRELRHADLCMTLDKFPTLVERARQRGIIQWGSPEYSHMYELGLTRQPHYSSGVMLFRRTPEVERLFATWHAEWSLFQRQDQLALMRAIARTGIAIHTLAPVWNALPEKFSSVAEAQSLGTRILHFCGSQRVPASLRKAPTGSGPHHLNAPRRPRTRGRRPRVLILTNTLFPRVGGQETFIERMTEHLADLCDIGLATRAGLWYPGDANIERFSIVDPPRSNPSRRWRAVCASLRRITAAFQPDLVHFGSARESIYRWAIPHAIPAVATVHGNDLTSVSAAHNNVPRKPSPLVDSLNACRRIFPTGRYTESLARAWGVSAPMAIHTPGCDTQVFRPRPALGEHARATLGIEPEMPLVLTVARLVPRKAHLNVLNAIAGLPFPVRWLVVGEGPCREQIAQAIHARQMSANVLLLGSVSDDELVGLYNACDVFVMTPAEERGREDSLDSEGFGLVFHEAGACGKPVIASDVSGCRDSVIDGRTGFLVGPGDATALRRTLEYILTHPQEAEALGAHGLESVRALGGWPRLARELVREYQDILRPDRLAVAPRAGARHAH